MIEYQLPRGIMKYNNTEACVAVGQRAHMHPLFQNTTFKYDPPEIWNSISLPLLIKAVRGAGWGRRQDTSGDLPTIKITPSS
jgi:hypothetical protein